MLQSKVETLAGENIKLLDDINRLQNAIPFISGKDFRQNGSLILKCKPIILLFLIY